MKLGLKSGPKLKLYINNYSCAYNISGLDHLTVPNPLAITSSPGPPPRFSMLHAEKQECTIEKLGMGLGKSSGLFLLVVKQFKLYY